MADIDLVKIICQWIKEDPELKGVIVDTLVWDPFQYQLYYHFMTLGIDIIDDHVINRRMVIHNGPALFWDWEEREHKSEVIYASDPNSSKSSKRP